MDRDNSKEKKILCINVINKNNMTVYEWDFYFHYLIMIGAKLCHQNLFNWYNYRRAGLFSIAFHSEFLSHLRYKI